MALKKKVSSPEASAKPAKKTAGKKVPAKKANDKKASAEKKAPARKAPAKKAASGKAAAKTSIKAPAKPLINANQKALLARLTQAVPLLDEECLEALVHSAENLAESCRQDIMLEEARSAAFRLLHGGSKKGPAAKPGRNRKGQADDASPIQTAIGMPAPLTVEVSEDKRFFHIVVDGKWKMLDLGELKILVRIASDKGSESALMTRMFTWLKRERSDVLNDLGISSAVSPILAELIAYLKANFKVMD